MLKPILVVNDNEVFLKVTSDMLERKGYQVVTSDDPEQALLFVEQKEWGLILVDYWMNGSNGIEFYERAKPISRGTKIVLISVDKDILRAAAIKGLPYTLRKENLMDSIPLLIKSDV